MRAIVLEVALWNQAINIKTRHVTQGDLCAFFRSDIFPSAVPPRNSTRTVWFLLKVVWNQASFHAAGIGGKGRQIYRVQFSASRKHSSIVSVPGMIVVSRIAASSWSNPWSQSRLGTFWKNILGEHSGRKR